MSSFRSNALSLIPLKIVPSESEFPGSLLPTVFSSSRWSRTASPLLGVAMVDELPRAAQKHLATVLNARICSGDGKIQERIIPRVE